MNNSTIQSILVGGILAILTGCTANQHIAAVQDTDTDRMTVGSVQKEITVGMPASRVAEIIGSPNIVTSDEQRRETWIYDKISTEVAYSNSSGGIAGLLIGGSGGGLAAGSLRSGATSTTQRTLTVIIHLEILSWTGCCHDYAHTALGYHHGMLRSVVGMCDDQQDSGRCAPASREFAGNP